jgi:hypothetical protein
MRRGVPSNAQDALESIPVVELLENRSGDRAN